MKQPALFPVILVSVLLIVYTIFLFTGWSPAVTGVLFFVSPFLVIWMVYRVIRHDKYTGRELNDGDEWGYADKSKEELNVF
jgi:membrane protein implicated in regulation of membrane protease activity